MILKRIQSCLVQFFTRKTFAPYIVLCACMHVLSECRRKQAKKQFLAVSVYPLLPNCRAVTKIRQKSSFQPTLHSTFFNNIGKLIVRIRNGKWRERGSVKVAKRTSSLFPHTTLNMQKLRLVWPQSVLDTRNRLKSNKGRLLLLGLFSQTRNSQFSPSAERRELRRPTQPDLQSSPWS